MKAIADGEKLFNCLMVRVQDMQTKLKSNIEQKLRKSQDKDEEMIRVLNDEIVELQMRQSELEELSHCDDHLHLLQVRLQATNIHC